MHVHWYTYRPTGTGYSARRSVWHQTWEGSPQGERSEIKLPERMIECRQIAFFALCILWRYRCTFVPHLGYMQLKETRVNRVCIISLRALNLPIFTRPPSNAFIAILKPSPSLPMRLVTGTLQFSRITARVGCEFHPSYSIQGLKRSATGKQSTNVYCKLCLFLLLSKTETGCSLLH